MDDFLSLAFWFLLGSIPKSRWKETPLVIKILVIFTNALVILFLLVILGAWFYNSLLR